MVVNLRNTYGKTYRVGRDPAADSWRDEGLHILRTRTGEVYYHSEAAAGVEVGARRHPTLRKLREAGYQIHQDADDVVVFLAPWADLDVVLPWLRPYKRRQVKLTDDQRHAVGERLAFARRAAG